MNLKPFVLIAAISVTASCHAQDYEKNGQPCVAELCIGDGMADIAKVKWDTAVSMFSIGNRYPPISGMKVSANQLAYLKKTYPEAGPAQASYLEAKKFDNASLPALAKLTAQCNNDYLEGNYTTPSGNPTHVRISLIPDLKDSSKQAWFVTTISRKFPQAVTQQQKAEVEAQLRERYQNYGMWNPKFRNRKPGESMASIEGSSNMTFNLLSFQGIEEADRRKQHPQCGGSAKVKID